MRPIRGERVRQIVRLARELGEIGEAEAAREPLLEALLHILEAAVGAAVLDNPPLTAVVSPSR
jgi:hypothetical protein